MCLFAKPVGTVGETFPRKKHGEFVLLAKAQELCEALDTTIPISFSAAIMTMTVLESSARMFRKFSNTLRIMSSPTHVLPAVLPNMGMKAATNGPIGTLHRVGVRGQLGGFVVIHQRCVQCPLHSIEDPDHLIDEVFVSVCPL